MSALLYLSGLLVPLCVLLMLNNSVYCSLINNDAFSVSLILLPTSYLCTAYMLPKCIPYL